MDDDFEDLEPLGKGSKKPQAAVLIASRAHKRSGNRYLLFSIEIEMLKRIGGAGWPRYSVAYSKGSALFRIRGQVQGPYEMSKLGKEPKSGILRVRIPPGLDLIEHEYTMPAWKLEGDVLYVSLPRVFIKPVPHAVKVAVADKAIPAPNFSAMRR